MKLFTQIPIATTRTSAKKDTAAQEVARRAAEAGYDKFGVVYRGQWGGEPKGVLRSFRASYSFGSKKAANMYAKKPNDSNAPGSDSPVPSVSAYFLKINKPIINDGDDPFVDLVTIAEVAGKDYALTVARKFTEYFQNTNNWFESIEPSLEDRDISGYDEYLEKFPDEAIQNLYCDIYPLLDDHEFVAKMMSFGYDGAIHGGAGETGGEVEWRVFSTNQAKLADPVTYDDQKNPIPLEMRFDFSNPDPRY